MALRSPDLRSYARLFRVGTGATLSAAISALVTKASGWAMSQTVVPMIHVPDVSATVNWYTSIGSKWYDETKRMAKLTGRSCHFSEVMLNAGGRPSTDHRREVDLYITTDNVDGLYGRLKDQVQVVEDLYDAFYGMREFIVRDINGFWVTFGQPLQT